MPCTPAGCLHLLQDHLGDLSGRHAVVVGRSNIVGKPMAALLLQAHCTVTLVHSRSRDAAALCRQADILVAAAGQPGLITAGWVKPGAVVIDVGINRVELEGNARLWRGADLVRGKKIIYEMDTGWIRADRVAGEVHPPEKDAKPSPQGGKKP